MKRIFLTICIISIIFTSAYAYNISFYDKVENPRLTLPEAKVPMTYGGSVIIEAENSLMSKAAVIIDDSNASGGICVEFAAGATADTIEKSDTKYTLKSEFNITKNGTYSLFVRILAKDSGSDSVYVSINDDNSYSAEYFKANTKWQWVNIGSSVLKQGIANIQFKYRESGFKVDKIIITSDLNFAPQGIDDVPDGMKDVNGETSVANPYPGEIPIYPPNERPRVLLNKSRVESVKASLESPEIKPAWENIIKLANTRKETALKESKHNYDASVVDYVNARALMYVLGFKDDLWAKETIRECRNVLETIRFDRSVSDVTRIMGEVMTMGAVVYDWCYSQMSNEDKEVFINSFKNICSQKEIGYPPKLDIAGVQGHMGEYEIHRDMLCCGIACYDEDPEMYILGAGALFSRFTESRKMFVNTGNHPEGSAYGAFRSGLEVLGDFVLTAIGYPSVYGENIKNIPMKFIYARQPDGYIMKEGDDYPHSQRTSITNYTFNDYTLNQMVNALYDNPYARGQYLRELAMQGYSHNSFWTVVTASVGNEFKFEDDLPLSYKTSYPLSSVIARTGWQFGQDANTAMASMRAYEAYINGHQHRETGSFQIYYKGSLALDGGNYQGKSGGYGGEHDMNYHKRSIAHNVVTVFDENEEFIWNGSAKSNDGGQLLGKESILSVDDFMSNDDLRATEKACFIGPNDITPEFSYIKSEISNSYSDKVESYERSMVFMDLFNDDYPAAFVVFDNITSSDKNFKKKWLLHSVEEPEIIGNTTTISRTEDGYNGKLVNKTFLPGSFEIAKVGGEGMEAYVDGANYPNEDKGVYNSEQGNWRIELSPKNSSENDLFLNAMYVTDYDRNLPELKMDKIISSEFVGVAIMDRQVMFSNNKSIKSRPFTINILDKGFDKMSCLITDVDSGTWEIISSDGIIQVVESIPGENVLYFKAVPGFCTIQKTTKNADKIIYEQAPKRNFGDFIIYNTTGGNLLYCELPNKLISGIPYVPIRSFAKQIGAEVYWDEANGCAIMNYNNHTAHLYAGALQFMADEHIYSLNSEIVISNGIMYVPILDFKDFIRYKTSYDSVSRMLNIAITKPDKSITDKYNINTDVIEPLEITASGDDGNVPENSADYNYKTRWSCEGTDAWIMYNLGDVYDISSLAIAFHSGDKRQTIFDIEVSVDDVNFTKVSSTMSSGITTECEEFPINTNAKFIRLRCHGNTSNLWNSITEFIVLK